MSESELTFPGFEFVDCRTPAFPDPPDNKADVQNIVPEDADLEPSREQIERQRKIYEEQAGEDVPLGKVHVEEDPEHKTVDEFWFRTGDNGDNGDGKEDDDDYVSDEQHKENISAGAHDEEIAAAFDSEMSPAEAVRLYGKRALRIWAGIALRRAGHTTELNLPTDDSYVNFWSNQGRPFARHGSVHTVNYVESSMPRKHNSWTVSDELAKALNANIAAQGGVK